jgi:iron complex transport system permease protein
MLELTLGQMTIPFGDTINIILGKSVADPRWGIIVLESRFPRAISAAIACSALATSGLMMQTLFRNPLAGPSILGISSGSSLGVALLMMASTAWGIHASGVSVALAAIIGALAVLFIILAVSHRLRENVSLLLFGIMLGYFTSAVVSILQFKSSQESLRSFVLWGMGSFSNTNASDNALMLIVAILASAVCFVLLRPMNIFLLGEDYAQSMGIRVKRMRTWLILGSGLLAGVVTAFCGPIAFVGLTVPHLSRAILKTSDHTKLFLVNILLGAGIGLACDLISRLGELPLNAITSALGAPVILYVLLRGHRSKPLI